MKNPVPTQHEGKQLDLRAATDFDNRRAAEDFYCIVRKRLLRAFEWYNIAKIPAATFLLTDKEGHELLREMKEGDLIRIDIPGPGNSSGDGFDWVRVEEIVEDKSDISKLCSVTLRPTSNPKHMDDETAHFFTKMATSTLLVKCEDTKVVVEYHGRNELINSEPDELTDKIRNIIVGLGAKLGLSYSQWKSLVEGMVDKESTRIS